MLSATAGGIMLAQCGFRRGIAAVEKIMECVEITRISRRFRLCVYTSPELSSVGLEREKRQQPKDWIIRPESSANGNESLLIIGDTSGLVKIIGTETLRSPGNTHVRPKCYGSWLHTAHLPSIKRPGWRICCPLFTHIPR